jgi:hypothetical protein
MLVDPTHAPDLVVGRTAVRDGRSLLLLVPTVTTGLVNAVRALLVCNAIAPWYVASSPEAWTVAT